MCLFIKIRFHLLVTVRENTVFSLFLMPHGKRKEEIGKPTKMKGENVNVNSVTEASFLLWFPPCPKGKDRLLGQDTNTFLNWALQGSVH